MSVREVINSNKSACGDSKNSAYVMINLQKVCGHRKEKNEDHVFLGIEMNISLDIKPNKATTAQSLLLWSEQNLDIEQVSTCSARKKTSANELCRF
eukprot:7029633-Ditylum_brightwellii.AAC.1